MQQRCGCFAQCLIDGLKSGDYIKNETVWLIIPFIQRKPGGWVIELANPAADQRGLAEAGWRGNKREFATLLQPMVEPLV